MTNPNDPYSTNGAPGAVGAPVSKTKWIVQLVVGFLCFGNIVTVVLAILGLVKADTAPAEADKYYKWGWIAYAIFFAINIIGLILYFVFVGSVTYSTYSS